MSAILEKSNKTVFVSGNFFVLHPGHLRLLKYASDCGTHLYVGINDTRPSKDYPSSGERAEILRELGLVHEVIVLTGGLENCLRKLKPDLIVKGKEYEGIFNPEEKWLKDWGGKLIFTAGDVTYSGTALLRGSRSEQVQVWCQPKEYIERHDCEREKLLPIIEKFKNLRIIVIGDLILDEYIQCEALGMSREDPALVLAPQENKRFLGGAGIVAAHCSRLGASVNFISVLGDDDCYIWAKEKLIEYGVKESLFKDITRVTTLKQRYRVGQKTMMRISHLHQHSISEKLEKLLYEKIKNSIEETDVIIFSDFNYGVLPQTLVENIIKIAKENNVMMAADSQTSSQIGDISRFKGVDLITPTEHEVRISLRESSLGLHKLAEKLINTCNTKLAVITLGDAGSLILDRHSILDRLPVINTSPVDISGAGDSMLVGITMSLAAESNSFQAAYIGALMSAIQISRVGNIPISLKDIKNKLFIN